MFRRLLLALLLPGLASAGQITDASFTAEDDALVFTLKADADIPLGQTSVFADAKGSVLVARVAGFSVKKRWLKFADARIKRSIIWPKDGGANLRVRLKDSFTARQVEATKRDVEGDTLIVRVPRDDATAAAWSAPVAVVAAPPAAPKTAPVKAAPVKAAPPAPTPAAAAPTQSKRDPTGSVQAGMQAITDDLAAQLEKGTEQGFRRVAVMPFEGLDPEVEKHRLDRITAELLAARLSLRPKILQVERSRLDSVVAELKRSERGELDPAGAASVGKLLGANAVVVGSVATSGPTYLVTARAVDAETGRIIVASDQPFTREGMVAFSEDAVEVKSKAGAALRSAAAPGWGQIYNGDLGRGIVYSTLFVGAAAGAITSAVLGATAENEYNENTPSTVDERDEANGHYERTNYFLIGLGAVWITSVVDAAITGKDYSTINVDVAADGATAGFGGVF